jgi:hypothetical protein
MAPRATGRGRRGNRRTGGQRSNVSPVPRGSQRQTTFNPATYASAPRNTRVLRFAGTLSVGPVVVTRASLLSLLCITNSANTFLAPIFSSVRLRKLTIWNSTVGVLNVSFASDLGEDRRYSRPYIGGPPSALVLTPPAFSRSAMWSRFGATTTAMREVLFAFGIEGNTITENAVIVDVDLEFTEGDGTGVGLTPGTPPGTAPQGIVGLPLDSLSTTNTIGTYFLLPSGIVAYPKPLTLTRSDG